MDTRHELAEEAEHEPISRRSTGIRMLLTVLFAVIWGVLESVLGVIVVFGLVWALVAGQAPPLRLRRFSNWLVTYSYRIWRYLSYNEPGVPFPFSEFPAPLEPTLALGADDARELQELLDTRRNDEQPPETE